MAGLLDLVTILYDPPAVFARVREKPQVAGPFVGLAVLQVVVAVLMLPYSRAAMQAMAHARGVPEAGDPSRFAVLGVVMAPVGLAIGLLLAAGILWLLVNLVAGQASFRHLLSVATYVGVTGVLMGFASVAVLALGGGRVETMADLRPAFGLDLLAPNASGPLRALLGAINPFTLWGWFLTALGVEATHKVSKGAAFTVASLALVLSALVAAGFALLGMGGR